MLGIYEKNELTHHFNVTDCHPENISYLLLLNTCVMFLFLFVI
ncbi:hypothetical protein Xmir_03468 [Xenorhabdus miraniensis]|uniref:Uncharacterized protein n=1 Tax=Xenorhabdus miraniensis TaxID=351674 RepID=A0A2D0JLS9_9GAMM|nr:hypothetical protein Xmir_03468 [Xenorhabdus miraniensis]